MENFKFEQNKSEAEKVEENISIFLENNIDVNFIINVLGKNSFVIGGVTRDVTLGRKISSSDIDIMTRDKQDEVLSRLDALGYKEAVFGEKFSENAYSIKKDKGVLNFLLNGKECQVGFVGDLPVETLVKNADLNINCLAYNLSSRKILNPSLVDTILGGEIAFANLEYASSDVMKRVSALKQISRMPDFTVSEDTMSILQKGMPDLVSYFLDNPDRLHKIQSCFNNINSGFVENMIISFSDNGIDLVNKIDKKFEIKTSHDFSDIESLSSSDKLQIFELIQEQYGKRFEEAKLFSQNKITGVSYIKENNLIEACCLFDRRRIYSVAAKSSEKIVSLVRDICENNNGIWATATISNKGIISLSQKAGLNCVTDIVLAEKILVSNYPHYKDRLVFDKDKEGRVIYNKIASQDKTAILLMSL